MFGDIDGPWLLWEQAYPHKEEEWGGGQRDFSTDSKEKFKSKIYKRIFFLKFYID